MPASLLLAALILSGCSLSYEEAHLAEDLAGETPDTVMLNFQHTVVNEGRVWVRLSAERAESFGQRKEVVLVEVRFQEYNAAGQLVTEARADRAKFNVASEDATAGGAIVIRAPEEKATLSASSLSWFKEGKRLESGAGETVRLEKEDGSFVEGTGFKADFRRRRLEFASSVRGSYVVGEE
jgi:LPS export ABC transporter protein LptC